MELPRQRDESLIDIAQMLILALLQNCLVMDQELGDAIRHSTQLLEELLAWNVAGINSDTILHLAKSFVDGSHHRWDCNTLFFSTL